ncbi:hypothetical protein CEUSTIGMA_g8917.t1 [Chlamydomonas eustigma]|uniref:Cation efflux protein transmembrane domain-containing protein n=1 Tax=Chlamydomonas eustigma TaxID=1157962 RepID=A0A250XEH5_9CHLO|nr:hypothetical protein CEUSTIGMA_g8917.t1 [Chlamydomonas eustigma]|eukprot:GAX81488.1 hypothetical protein CEUSTIGMA_g8917.t1 [Chlamydomonas eustigma]
MLRVDAHQMPSALCQSSPAFYQNLRGEVRHGNRLTGNRVVTSSPVRGHSELHSLVPSHTSRSWTSDLRNVQSPYLLGRHHLSTDEREESKKPLSLQDIGLASRCKASATAIHAADMHDEQSKRELRSLNVAIVVNVLIFFAKGVVHLITGSSSMLAEALHSIADVLNQMLLRIGVLKSLQAPTQQFQYGYLRDRFVWSLISGVGIFFLGSGASIIHGLHALHESHQVEGIFWTYLVLGVSAALEAVSLYVAYQGIKDGAAARNMSVTAYITSGVDPTTVAVLMEDGGAIVGLMIAGLGTALTQYTGSALFDAMGSIGVGLLLGVIATFLVSKNRQLLLGRSMNPKEVQEVQSLLRRDAVVSYILDTKTEEIGPSIFRFKAEVAWDGEQLAGRYLSRVGRERFIARLQEALKDPDPTAIDQVLKAYGRGIISAVGAEVDRLETEIQSLNPGIRFVDLETDRGRARAGPVNVYDNDFDPGPVSEHVPEQAFDEPFTSYDDNNDAQQASEKSSKSKVDKIK